MRTLTEEKPSPVLLLLLQQLHGDLPQIQNLLQLIVFFLNQLLFV